MELNKESACEILKSAEELEGKFHESVAHVIANEDVAIAAEYRKAAASYLGNIVINIMMPIWQYYPELKPERLNEPYIKPKPSAFSQDSINKINICIRESEKFNTLVENSVSKNSRDKLFAYGGLEEISEMLIKINQLLEKYNNNEK